MKTLNYNLILLIGLLMATTGFANDLKEYTKVITEEYSIASDGEVEINNKYGHINIVPGTSNTVKIEVTITVDAKNEEQAQEVFDRVNIAFTNSASYVRATTEISTAKGWGRWWDSGDKFEVSYKVELPATVDIDLDNKYGDIYVGSMEGNADLDVKYGSLRMDGTTGNLKLDIGYGKGSITSAGDLDLVMKYSALKCGTVGDIRAETKYSGFEVEEAGDVRSTSSYDNYDIGQVRTFNNYGKYDDVTLGEAETAEVETKYSNLVIQNLRNEADLTFKYGAITLERVQEGFSSIEITSEYTGVKITTDPGARFSFDAITTHCPVKYSGLEVYIDKQSSSGDTEVKGYRGSKDSGGSIVVRSKYGGVKIY